MKLHLQQVRHLLLAAFACIGLATGYWGIWQQAFLSSREDNPRRVLAAQQIWRGSIIDKDDQTIAYTAISPEGIAERYYDSPRSASVIGYYSFRFGAGGLEDVFDSILRGDQFADPGEAAIAHLLHRPQRGWDIRLTLQREVQESIDSILGERTGAILIINASTGELLALTSHPSFDPNTLDEKWETLTTSPDAPLLNRATQGLYQPGTILQTAILAAVLEGDEIGSAIWEQPITPPHTVRVQGSLLPCALPSGNPTTLVDAYLAGCPAPFPSVAHTLGTAQLDQTFRRIGFYTAPSFDLPTAVDNNSLPLPAELALAAIGQGSQTVTPLHMVRLIGAVATDGSALPLIVVTHIRPPDEEAWQPYSNTGLAPVMMMHPLVARELREQLCRGSHLPLQSTDRNARICGHVGIALSGSGQAGYNTWFIGFTNTEDGQALAVTVLLEEVRDATEAVSIAQRALIVARTATDQPD